MKRSTESYDILVKELSPKHSVIVVKMSETRSVLASQIQLTNIDINIGNRVGTFSNNMACCRWVKYTSTKGVSVALGRFAWYYISWI